MSESEVVLFLSADLTGSTAYKAKSWQESEYRSGRPPWADKFDDFYRRFPEDLRAQWKLHSHDVGLPPAFVKAIGDEILLAKVIETRQQCHEMVRAFMASLKRFNDDYAKEHVPLELKGTAWIAGFPINNHKITVAGEQYDYIGPSMDVGFRLARFSTRRKLVISVDLALLLKDMELRLYYDGRELLKGALGDRAYPIVWADMGITAEDRLLGVRKEPCAPQELDEYCRQFIASCGESSWLIVPYLVKDDIFKDVPPRHKNILKDWKHEDAKVKDIGSDARPPDHSLALDLKELYRHVTSISQSKTPSGGPLRAKQSPKRVTTRKSSPTRKRKKLD